MLARLVLISCMLCVAPTAFADASVVVLGLRSIEGDDDVANELTNRLRSAATSVPGWSVSNAAVSMAQMSLAHGCEEVDASCLKDIAEGLKSDVVIYGTLRRNSAREDYDFALGVGLFDARTGAIERTLDDIVPRGEAPEQMDARAQKLIARLASTSAGGTIAIQASAADAQVRVNGQDVGRTRDGALRLGGLAPGQYRIEVLKDGFVPHVSTVTVTEGSDTAITAVLTPAGAGSELPPSAVPENYYYDDVSGGGHQLGWLGWTLIGVSAASLAGMGISMAIIDDIDEDDLMRRYSTAVFQGNQMVLNDDNPNNDDDAFDDVCEAARRGFDYRLGDGTADDVADKCDSADTMEVLQYVFLGTAIAAAGAGLALILTADDGPTEQARKEPGPTLALQPRFGLEGAGVRASLRF